MSEYRFFEALDRQGVLVLRLQAGGGDRGVVNELGRELTEYLEGHKPTRLAINLAAFSELSSPMLGKLILLDKRMAAYGGRLIACEVSGSVRQVIALAWPRGLGESAEPLSEAEAVEQLKNWECSPQP